ncbi:unnamed protein product, partial [Effrenium voratum]
GLATGGKMATGDAIGIPHATGVHSPDDVLHVVYRGFGPDWIASALIEIFGKTEAALAKAHSLAKLHTWLHMWLRLRIFPINPKINACFGDEDLVQRICDVASGCHHRGTATNAVRRFLCVAAVHWITVCR